MRFFLVLSNLSSTSLYRTDIWKVILSLVSIKSITDTDVKELEIIPLNIINLYAEPWWSHTIVNYPCGMINIPLFAWLLKNSITLTKASFLCNLCFFGMISITVVSENIVLQYIWQALYGVRPKISVLFFLINPIMATTNCLLSHTREN